MSGTFPYAAPIVLVVAVVGYLWWWRHVPRPVQRLRDEDGNDPLERWARGCYSILYGGASPERRRAEECREGLDQGWDIHSGEEVLAASDRLGQVPTGRVVWDPVRAVGVARLGSAAGFVSMAQAQTAVGRIQRRLQEAYSGWEEMAADCDAVVREKGFGLEHRQGRPAAREIWRVVPFQ